MKEIKNKKKIHLLAFSWRDIHTKKSGGAEVYSHEMFKRLIKDGYQITHLACSDGRASEQEDIDGVSYIRRGNFISVWWHAWKVYTSLPEKPDLVIDQCNTHRFFTPLWLPKKQKRVLFIHQNTKELWFFEKVFGSKALAPLNYVAQSLGRLFENSLLIWPYINTPTMTVCESTKEELVGMGIRDVVIIPEGKDFDALLPEKWTKRQDAPAFVYAGRYVPYKRIDHVVKAFCEVLTDYPDAELWMLGRSENKYAQSLRALLKTKKQQSAVKWLGFVSEEEKRSRMRDAHALLYASRREGWGIPVIEAACMGTPSIVYDVPGLRDAVDHGNAGLIVREEVGAMAGEMKKTIALQDDEYEILRRKAYDFSSGFHWDKTAAHADDFFKKILSS